MNKPFPKLTSTRLILDETKSNDAKTIFEMFSDKEVVEFYDFAQFTDLNQANVLINDDLQKYQSGTHLRWAVRDKVSNAFLGSIGIKYSDENHSATLSYEFKKSTWGKGIATEALQQVIHFLLQDHSLKNHTDKKINRIQAYTMQGNIGSEKVLNKLGFQKEGLLRQHGFWKGQYHDLNIFSILKSDLS
jgi:ribosomal-protein-alanine N-acetyltransferase